TPSMIESVNQSFDPQNIKIAQRDSVMWGTHQQESINYGNLVHEVLSFVQTEADMDIALEKSLESGLINIEQLDSVRLTLIQILSHPDLAEFFNGSNKVLNEQSIIRKKGSVLKPDRMVVNPSGEVFLLDYKTGSH